MTAFTEAQIQAGAAYALSVYSRDFPTLKSIRRANRKRIADETAKLLRDNLIGAGLLLAAIIAAGACVAQLCGAFQ